MSTFYLDYQSGDDAADGSTFSLVGLPAVGPWKTITAGATAARIAPGDIIRIAKSADPTGIGNATWTNLSRTITLTAQTSVAFTDGGGGLILATKAAHNFTTGDIVTVSASTDYDGTYAITVASSSTFTFTKAYVADRSGTVTPAFTKVVDLCETAWTANPAGDVTVLRVAVGTDGKEGSYSMNFTTDAAVQASIMQAYYATGTLDLSLYQKLSFWIKNEAAIADAVSWKICLCSDVAGATPVDTFYVPAIPSTVRWLPLTLTKNGGGNLGNAIKSIAIYSDTTAPAASKYVYVDDFVACTTNGLNLQSLISKNGAAQGGTEGFYGIQSINGVTVLLDNDTNTKGNQGRGYSGTTELVATYIRETIKTDLAAASGDSVQVVQDSGTLALGNIQFQSGYDTALNTQIGETFFDGLNGNGYGIYLNAKSYITLNYLNVCRYRYGVSFDGGSNSNIITTLTNANNNTFIGVYFGAGNNNIITTLTNANNNSNYGVYFIGSGNNNIITTLTNANNNSYGVSFASSNNSNIITTLTNANNNYYGVSFSSSNNNIIRSLSTTGNATAGVYNDTGVNYIYKAIIAEATEVAGAVAFANSRIYSQMHDNTPNNHWIFTDGGTINSQTTTRHTASGIAWKFAITSSNRASNYPLTLSVAKLAVAANNQVTCKIWMKKDHATNVAGKLVCRGGQLSGVSSDVTDTKADDTDWEQLSISFTPTETGVIEIEAWAYYSAGSSNVYVDDFDYTIG